MELFKPGKQYDFMGMRKFWITLSLSLTAISLALLFYPGPNYGTDFRGGTELEVAFPKEVSAEELRHATTAGGKFSEPDIVEVRDTKPNHFIIRVQEVSTLGDDTKLAVKKAMCTEAPESDAACAGARATEVKFSAGGDKIAARYDSAPDLEKVRAQLESVKGIKIRHANSAIVEANARDHRVEIQLESMGDQLLATLSQALGADRVPEQALRVEWVGPKAGEQLRKSAINSVLIAVGFILVYLAFRFDLRFAPGVVLACLHDALVVLGVFVLLRKEVTLATVAAVLTIVGYSMNDTVVVYDRIRENISRHKGKPFAEIINLSVSETLSRTLLTSGATMLSVLAFFIWGTGIIKDFALAVVIGIVAGTYSSIYVAAPLTEWIDRKMAARPKRVASTRKRVHPAITG